MHRTLNQLTILFKLQSYDSFFALNYQRRFSRMPVAEQNWYEEVRQIPHSKTQSSTSESLRLMCHKSRLAGCS